MRVAICYDWLDSRGGAERILLALKEIYPEANYYSLVYQPNRTVSLPVNKVRTSFIQKIWFISRLKFLMPFLGPWAWAGFDFREYDAVIVVTSDFGASIRVLPETKTLYLCLTPPRYLWTEYHRSVAGKWKHVLRILAPFLRVRYYYLMRSKQIHVISVEVAQRFRTYLGLNTEVIYPPVSRMKDCGSLPVEDYFLVVSRLVPYKRVDIVVKSFRDLDWPLVVVGKGSELKSLKQDSGLKTKFVGEVSEDELLKYYQGAIALVFPSYEDFGIVPVEAQLYGVPVVALKAGGAIETVQDGVTGIFFEEQSVESLKSCLLNCGRSLSEVKVFFAKFNKVVIIKNAEKFSKESFMCQIATIMR